MLENQHLCAGIFDRRRSKNKLAEQKITIVLTAFGCLIRQGSFSKKRDLEKKKNLSNVLLCSYAIKVSAHKTKQSYFDSIECSDVILIPKYIHNTPTSSSYSFFCVPQINYLEWKQVDFHEMMKYIWEIERLKWWVAWISVLNVQK